MSQDVAKFIAIVGLHFPPPKKAAEPEYDAWMASMVRFLRGYPGDVLAQAADEIILTRCSKKDGRCFPEPRACIEACEDAKRRLAAASMPLLAKAEPEIPYEGRVQLARDLMKSSVGKRAIREGWGPSMFHYCVAHCMVPGDREIEGCKREAKQFAAAYEGCVKGEHPLGGPLARLADSMVRKARELMETPA